MAAAESCTGGLIAAACTSLAGSSDWFERGFVTYSNAAKTEMLGVPEALIAAHGAVSAEVAAAMAEGALARSHAQVAVAVTGIAGPGWRQRRASRSVRSGSPSHRRPRSAIDAASSFGRSRCNPGRVRRSRADLLVEHCEAAS